MVKPTAIVTGASSGIGAVYADRLASRGYDLILVARDRARLQEAGEKLREKHGAVVTSLPADLGKSDELELVLDRLANEPEISLIVNSAGIAPNGSVLTSIDRDSFKMIDLNVRALHSLTVAAAKAFAARGSGGIINIASVVALMPERFNGSYAAAKAFVLALSQALDVELNPKGVRIQAVLPGFTRTEIFDRAGVDSSAIPPHMMMDAGDMVDAALAGFDRGEVVTIPSLENQALWSDFESSRRELWPHLSLDQPAPRYRG